jgi:hypothetical protein
MVVKNLEFFDKDGYNLNLKWNEQKQIWEGNIFFPRVSVGLYENTTIYIVEGIGVSEGSMDDAFSYPTGYGNITFQWDLANTFVDEFFMFNFEDYVVKDTSSLVYNPYDGPLCDTLIVNRFDKYIVPLLGSSPAINQDDLLEVHIAFRSDEKSAETTYKRTLIITSEILEKGTSQNVEIARITFFAETIEEDERLKIWNENLGYNLKPEDSVIFKQSDLHESMPNFELLNEKRKELMLEGHNIYSYIGGYKAILNAIKFFGYDNLNIVEYWRNINQYDKDFGKICRTYIYSLKDRKTISTKRKPISLDTKDYQKLSNISLVYNINHTDKIDGFKYDEYGLPNVIEDFDKNKRDDFKLTIEEALVKLFALKKKLNNEFMPGSTKITDIIGEGNYFGINLIGNNPQISYVNYVEANGYIDFTVFPDKHCYITENEDFARYVAEKTGKHVDETIGNIGNKTIEELEELYTDIDNSGDITINEIDFRSLGHIISDLMKNENDKVCEFYEEYYDMTFGNNFNDSTEYGLREEPEPRNVYKDVILDDIQNDPYGENEYVPDMIVCAKVILKGNFSENIDGSSIVEWKITHQDTGWTVTHLGSVKICGNMFVQLPYLGNYDVEMTVWDIYNHCSKRNIKDAIIVKPYNIDIRGFYYDARPLPKDLRYELMIPKEHIENTENEYRYYLWSKIDSDIPKGVITYKRNPMEMELTDIFGECIVDNDGKYVSLKETVELDKKNWISIVNTDDDGEDVLKISFIKDNIGVDVYDFVEELTDIPFDENVSYSSEWNKDELYNVIKNNVDKMYSWALQEHLGVSDENMSMRNYRPDGSVNSEGPYYKFDVDTILYRIERGYNEYDHLNEEIINLEPGKYYEYVRYINGVVDIKPLTWVLLGFDYTRITGRIINDEYPKWTLVMIGNELEQDEDLREDKIIATHNGLYFTYLFENEGSYKIKLEMKDINGNEYEIEKFIVIVDEDANYEMYHTLKDEYDKYIEAKNERNSIYLN